MQDKELDSLLRENYSWFLRLIARQHLINLEFRAEEIEDLMEREKEHRIVLSKSQNGLELSEQRISSLEKEIAQTRKKHDTLLKKQKAYEEVGKGFRELEEFYQKIGCSAPVEKNALGIISHLRAALKKGGKEVTRTKELIEETKRKNIVAEALLYLESDKIIFILDSNNRIKAVSKAAEFLVGRNIPSGKKPEGYLGIGKLTNMIEHVASTYEPCFDLDAGPISDLKDAVVEINIQRASKNYIGSVLIVEEKESSGWFKRKPGKKNNMTKKGYILQAPAIIDNAFGYQCLFLMEY